MLYSSIRYHIWMYYIYARKQLKTNSKCHFWSVSGRRFTERTYWAWSRVCSDVLEAVTRTGGPPETDSSELSAEQLFLMRLLFLFLLLLLLAPLLQVSPPPGPPEARLAPESPLCVSRRRSSDCRPLRRESNADVMRSNSKEPSARGPSRKITPRS